MHPLDGPLAKIDRAKVQTKTLQDDLHGFFKKYPYVVVVAERDRKTGHYNLRVHIAPPPFPDDWGVLIGEIAHNLRSALDGLAWQLALLNPAISEPYPRTAFPIYLLGHTKRRRPSGDFLPHFWGKGDGVRVLQSIEPRFWTGIEGFQPYKGGNGGRHSPLFLLNELNNADKHRLITVVTAVPASYTMVGTWVGGGGIKRGVSLYLNAKVGSVPPPPEEGFPFVDDSEFAETGQVHIMMKHEVDVETTITPGVLFGSSCDAVKGLVVIPTIRSMADEVSSVIESFAGKF